jgi:hypothetical protein
VLGSAKGKAREILLAEVGRVVVRDGVAVGKTERVRHAMLSRFLPEPGNPESRLTPTLAPSSCASIARTRAVTTRSEGEPRSSLGGLEPLG